MSDAEKTGLGCRCTLDNEYVGGIIKVEIVKVS